jgi:catalase (peroxidase I)
MRFHEHPDDFRLAFAKSWFNSAHVELTFIFHHAAPPRQV